MRKRKNKLKAELKEVCIFSFISNILIVEPDESNFLKNKRKKNSVKYYMKSTSNNSKSKINSTWPKLTKRMPK